MQAAVLTDPTLPASGAIARTVDPLMNTAMAETALWAALSLHRGFFTYAQQQRNSLWQQLAQRLTSEVSVLVLGQGQMGRAVAARRRCIGEPAGAGRSGHQTAAADG